MPCKNERSDIAAMVRSVISAWIVFLAMFLGSVLYSTIDSAIDAATDAASDAALSDFAGRPLAPGEFAQKYPAVSGATE